jgi:hypothetical protein
LFFKLEEDRGRVELKWGEGRFELEAKRELAKG